MNINNLNFCISQYNVIGHLQKGDKLEVLKNENRELQITPASWFQSYYRKNSPNEASWRHSTQRIKEINDLTSKCLEEFKAINVVDPQKNYEKIEKLNLSLQSAEEHLLLIKESSYSRNPEAKNTLDTLISNMETIRKTILHPIKRVLIEQIKSGTRTDEQDFINLVESDITSKSDITSTGKNEFRILTEERLKFLGDEEEDKSQALLLSSLMDTDSFYEISNKHEQQLPEKWVRSLKEFSSKVSPFLSSEDASQRTLTQLKDCFGNVTDESTLSFVDQDLPKILQSINVKLNALHPDGGKELNQKRELIKDLLIATAFPPSIKDQNIRILTPQKLLSILEKIAKDPSMEEIFSNINSQSYFDRKTSMYQKLFLISILNFENKSILTKIHHSPLYGALYYSPALPNFLSNTKIHVPQTYRQTCVGTVHNLHFQQKCGTILELLAVLQETIELAQNNLRKAPNEELEKPTYQSNVGAAPPKRDYIERVIALVKQEHAKLQERAEQIAENKLSATTSQEIASLTRDWNFAMQYLETVLNPKKIVIPNKQLLPDFYRLSAVLSAFATGLTAYYPGEPILASRWAHSIDGLSLRDLNNKLFSSTPFSADLIKRAKNGSPIMTDLWKMIHHTGGAVWNCSVESFRGSTRHAIFLEAVLVNGQEKFRIFDPMKAEVQECTFEELKAQIKGYDSIYSF